MNFGIKRIGLDWICKILRGLKRTGFGMIWKQILHSHGMKRIQLFGIRRTQTDPNESETATRDSGVLFFIFKYLSELEVPSRIVKFLETLDTFQRFKY